MITTVENGVIRVFDTLNSWIDCIFLVSETEVENTKQVLEKAWDEFWEQNDEPYGVFLERALYEAGIEYEVFYKNAEEEM